MESQGPSVELNEGVVTIDDMATVLLRHDIRRALGALGCTPQCMEDWGVFAQIDVAYDFVTTVPSFDPLENDLFDSSNVEPTVPTKIEVMLDGVTDTVMTSSFHSEDVYSGSANYEYFRGIEQPLHCSQVEFLTTCGKCPGA